MSDSQNNRNVKYRFQNPSRSVRYRSTFHALMTITREEHLRGLFKGISSPLATAPLFNGLLFATYRFLLKVQVQKNKDDSEPTLDQIFLAGAGCGLASTLLTTPIELIKIQQQKEQQHLHLPAAYRNRDQALRTLPARTVALHIFRVGGIPGLYRGLSATILRDVGGFGMYFAGYEGTLRFFTPSPTQHTQHDHHDHHPPPPSPDPITRPLPWLPLLLAGGAAGILGWIITFPFDVIKTRMQAQDFNLLPSSSSSSSLIPLQNMTMTTRSRNKMYITATSTSTSTSTGTSVGAGVKVFWRGLMPTIVRAIPVNMAVFGTFEAVVWAFSS
ncbi:mitochondrial carrier domain-containing protein [Multifurca ochricompacta]|uniref:Mitochondrial carrier domain-containing protein n=1 Tax=Multifurca ochricompacta TaxID=376703 RepID=A0AAD4M105_9AGAM|nr:mitochondrial carrier domain-containing protein [Multifurca ochricompacta]